MKWTSAFLLVLILEGRTLAITRDRIMVRARSFAFHPWRCTQANLTGDCDPNYRSAYVPGDYVGLPYDWGGFVTLFEFDQQIAAGFGAGSSPTDGVLSCTTGLDCSGFVSQCWDTPIKYGTANLDQVSDPVDASDVLPGDAFNWPGYHVVLFGGRLADGSPELYEAIGYNVHVNVYGGWSYLNGYTPIRYRDIQGTDASAKPGTLQEPIPITGFPFTDSRDTTQSSSDVLDGCGAAPDRRETGPEYVYVVEIQQPGTLTITVSDDVGVDIDVHLYTSPNTNDCIARNDTTITYDVDCGTYYIVADTWANSSGTEYPGPYDLTVDFSPSGNPCGQGPEGYHPSGAPGDACAHPGQEDLPFCNPNLGADTCLYTSNSSFCSHPCSDDTDCSDWTGSCCQDIGRGDFYCVPAAYCGAPVDPDAGPPDSGPAVDAGPPARDGARPDTHGLDGNAPDAGALERDAATQDEGVEAGCSCHAASPPPWWALLALIVAVGGGRRRKEDSR